LRVGSDCFYPAWSPMLSEINVVSPFHFFAPALHPLSGPYSIGFYLYFDLAPEVDIATGIS